MHQIHGLSGLSRRRIFKSIRLEFFPAFFLYLDGKMKSMKFGKLVEYLERLDKTDSRNAMTEILAELLEVAEVKEVGEVVYLILGKLRPDYDSLEFNLAEKQVIKSIARAEGVDEGVVRKSYKKLGDLGMVVEEMGSEGNGEKMSVMEVYKKLVKIAEDEGNGSQERKIAGLADLIRELPKKEGKYVVKIVIGRLRLGFSDKTVMDAISVWKLGDKSGRKKLESAYQVKPDVGLLAIEAKTKGVDKIAETAEMELGIPVSPMLCQRIKSPEDMIKKMGDVAVEPKFDGTRVQIHYRRGKKGFVRTFTRNLEETSHMFPELIKMGEHVKADELVLDSEAVGYDPKTGKMLPFQMTITRKRKHGVEERAGEVPVKFYVFDILYKDGKSLVNEKYEKRREILKEVVKDKELLVVDDEVETMSSGEIVKYYREQIKRGLEGVIVKKLGSKYVPGRTGWRWVKMKEEESAAGKLSDTIDGVVMGTYVGKGKRTAFGIGKFLVGVREGDKIVTIAKIGTGLTDAQFRELKKRTDALVVTEKPKKYGMVDKSLIPDVWIEPELVVEVAADEVTKSPVHSAGIALRFPRLVRFRDDKGVDEATTVGEVKEMQ